MSEKGKRMANSIGEYVLMRYFFGPESIKDRKKYNNIKQLFINDMQFFL